jgi:MFS family permease
MLKAASRYDNSLFTGLLALTQWTKFMDNPTGAYLGAINAIQSAGVVVAYPVMAFIANKWGRKKSVYIGLFFVAFGVGLATGAVNPAMYFVSRFFIGCASGLFGSVLVLVAETAYPTHRGQMTAIYQ